MKCSWLPVTLFSVSLVFISCSDNGDKEQGTNTAVQSSATTPTTGATLSSVAKEKISDAVVKGLKGKVEVLSESISATEPSKKLSSKNVFKYDEKGNMTELSSYTSDGKLVSTIKTSYDANGAVTSEQTILGNGNVELTSTIKSDAKGNRIEQQDVRSNATTNLFNYNYFYVYDEKGQLLERTAFRGNNTLAFKYIFKYDAAGNKIEWTQGGSDGSIVGKVLYKYDDKNNLTEEIVYDSKGEVKSTFTYTYEFDKKGNWKSRTKLQDNKAIEIKERQIIYD